MAIEWEYLGKAALPPGHFAPLQVETWRAKVPGGWPVMSRLYIFGPADTLSTVFYPDPQHEWDGSSLP